MPFGGKPFNCYNFSATEVVHKDINDKEEEEGDLESESATQSVRSLNYAMEQRAARLAVVAEISALERVTTASESEPCGRCCCWCVCSRLLLLLVRLRGVSPCRS